LITGLAGENKRWNETVAVFEVKAGKLVGDVLLAASFVSYCGPFNMLFRSDLVNEKWLKDLIERKIPITDKVVPLDQLSSDTEKAQWGNEGLPTDPLSVENGAIMMNSSRTTLMIDPQLQVCCLMQADGCRQQYPLNACTMLEQADGCRQQYPLNTCSMLEQADIC
jgi:dynein heavy chain, axonemal